MKPSEQIKPVSYLKENAEEIIRNLNAENSPMFITQDGEARAVLMDIKSYEDEQETIGILKVMANHSLVG